MPGEELTKLGDADLVARARAGEDAPYAELFRRHRPAATALARTLTDEAAADDVVAEAFEKLLLRIRAGGGPQSAFRPYLLQTVRTVAVDAARRVRRLVVAEDPESAATPEPSHDDSLFDTVFERSTLARAFGALPERWQTMLWLSFVEGADRHEIATIMGINAAGVSALGFRAREGLRRAYLDAHLVAAPTTRCAEVWPLLSGSVRHALTPTQQKKVDGHVAECGYCREALHELDSVNHRLGVLLAPLVLGAAAPAYLGARGTHTAAAGSAAGTTAGSAGLLGLVKGGAAGMAVLASTSTVAVVAMLAILTAPDGVVPSADPGPDQVVSDVARQPGSRPPGGDLAAPTADDGSATPAVPTSAGAPTSATTGNGGPTGGADPTGSPTGLPTSGGPTSAPTWDPTTAWTTPTATPTAGPTATPTDQPTAEPTSQPTPTGGAPTSSPTADGTPSATPTSGGPTPSGTPTTTPPPPADVNARLGNVALAPRPDDPGLFMHAGVPVALTGGRAGLTVIVSVAGLASYEVAAGPAYGAWSCVALSPMAGEPKIARLQCSLPNAAPTDALDLGLNLNYVGDTASMTADLTVAAPAVDGSAGDDTATSALPPRRDVTGR